MGLLSNLRVLIGSDIGEKVRSIYRQVETLRTDFDELADLTEARYRRLNKRARDAAREPQEATTAPEPVQTTGNARIDRLRLRRARRRGQLHVMNGDEG